MTKEMVLRIPDKLFEVIKKFKAISGVSHTNFIYNAILWYCVSKNLISLKELREKKDDRYKFIPGVLEYYE